MWTPDVFKAYEEGKSRRYSLLFAVNGGAFAIAELLVTPKGKVDDAVLGTLTLLHLSVGMVLFTVLMTLDIFLFGQGMRAKVPELFALPGKAVLTVIGLLVAGGWTVVSFGLPGLALLVPVHLGIFVGVCYLTERRQEKMSPLTEEVKRLNEDLFRAENRESIRGESWEDFLKRVLATDFRIRRASGDVVQDKREMIEHVRGDKRKRVPPADPPGGGEEGGYGVVTSTVTLEDDPDKKKYPNLKVFFRQPGGQWQCVYWRVMEQPGGEQAGAAGNATQA